MKRTDKLLRFAFSILLGGLMVACNSNTKNTTEVITLDNIKVIPKPAAVEPGVGFFYINSSTTISVANEQELYMAERLFSQFSVVSGWKPTVGVNLADADIVSIADSTLSNEAYKLTVTTDHIEIRSSSYNGFIYSLQTLKQLLPTEFVADQLQPSVEWTIPSVAITDAPEFGWRGYMLDVSRHFFDKKQVKDVLDFMCDLKLNRFHWHLADDQGWRVEIKSYPKLTSVGAWRVDCINYDETKSDWWGRPTQKSGDKATYGGFYTQEDIKEIVAYAKQLGIEIIPEIDMPGHAQATIAAYPEIGCVDKYEYVATGGVFHNNTYNPGKPETYKFAETVLNEVMDLFPFNYVHIGGDECNKDQWAKDPYVKKFMKKKKLKDLHAVQSYFISEVEKMINKRGRNMIGWDEILDGGLAPNATVMSWRGTKGGIKSAKMGHDVIMTPNSYCYLDLKQGHDDLEPNLGYGESLLSASYNYALIDKSFTPEQADHILGIQGNLWTESISDWGKLTYMTYPRLFAIAENGWTSEKLQDWSDFIERLYPQLSRLDNQGVRYAKSAYSVWVDHKGDAESGSIEISLKVEASGLDIRYTTDGSAPTKESQLYSKPFSLLANKGNMVKAAAFLNGEVAGYVSELEYPVHSGIAATASSRPATKSAKVGAWINNAGLNDLNYGRLTRGDKSWIKFKGSTDLQLSFDKPTTVSSIKMNTLRFTIAGIYPPKRVVVWGELDGKLTELGSQDLSQVVDEQGRNKILVAINFPSITVDKLIVKAALYSVIPEGHHKAGSTPTLAVDEIVVR